MGPDAVKSRFISSTWQPDPLREIDEWTVLADGSLAIVRGHDYHVDFVRPDGTKHAGPKLPFDWRRVSDEEKSVLIDPAAAQRVSAARNNRLIAGVERAAPPWKITGAFPDTTDALPTENIGRFRFLVLPSPRPSVEHVFDYYPPVRAGSVLADRDNRLWILPNTSKQSKAGELVYDVLNNQGVLIKRVRLPIGRYIVGFGRNGVVYLATGSIANGFTVERTQLPK